MGIGKRAAPGAPKSSDERKKSVIRVYQGQGQELQGGGVPLRSEALIARQRGGGVGEVVVRCGCSMLFTS